MNQLKNKYEIHPLLFTYIISVIGIAVWAFGKLLFTQDIKSNYRPDDYLMLFLLFVIGTFCLALPLVLTLFNIMHLLLPHQGERMKRAGERIEYETGILGVLYLVILFGSGLLQIRLSNWDVALKNGEIHFPISLDKVPTVVTVLIVALVGYAVLSWGRKHCLPPLVLVFGIASTYIGMIGSGLWIYQVFSWDVNGIYLSLLSINYILVNIKVMRELIFYWTNNQKGEMKPFARHLGKWLNNAKNWPWLAVLALVPLAIVLVGILALFGQAPDSIIRAFTETADWRLSHHVAPQSIQVDEHYLCTVAAGGHKKVVKPLRMGKRHGHRVVVNRQLCIANAFEQILEEHTPRIHKAVRGFYDRYGYPFAKHIRSQWGADAIYIIMKPLEWLFLIVIYFCDIAPENRIAVQYLPGAPKKVKVENK